MLEHQSCTASRSVQDFAETLRPEAPTVSASPVAGRPDSAAAAGPTASNGGDNTDDDADLMLVSIDDGSAADGGLRDMLFKVDVLPFVVVFDYLPTKVRPLSLQPWCISYLCFVFGMVPFQGDCFVLGIVPLQGERFAQVYKSAKEPSWL